MLEPYRSLFRTILVACICIPLALSGTQLAAGQEDTYQTHLEDILAELEEIRSYYDDSGHWQSMCDHFQQVLEQRADGLIVDMPPSGEYNRVADFQVLNDGMGNYWAEWTYRNAGDCDENGHVGIYDLTSMESYFGTTEDDEDWESARSCDGNRDGIIDLQDVAVIADNYGNRIELYRVVSSFDPPSQPSEPGSGAYIYRVIGTVDAQDQLGSQYRHSIHFRCELDAGNLADYIWVEPAVSMHGAVSNVYNETGLTARLTAYPLSGAVPLEVSLKCYGTTGADGDAAVAWDFDGDGVFGGSGYESPQECMTMQHRVVLDSPHCRLTAVRITNQSGESDTAIVPITAYRAIAWENIDPALAAKTGNITPAFVNDLAALAYFIEAGDGIWQLRYVSALDTDLEHWSEPAIVAELQDKPLGSPRLAEIAGFPALSYLTGKDGDETGRACYAGAAARSGEAWHDPVLISDRVYIKYNKQAPPLVALGDRPALAYAVLSGTAETGARNPGAAILFHTAEDASGRLWNAPVEIDTAEPEAAPDARHRENRVISRLESLIVVDGRPVVMLSGHNTYGGAAYLACADDPAGTSWGELEPFEQFPTGNTGSGRLAGDLKNLGNGFACMVEYGLGNPTDRSYSYVLNYDTGEETGSIRLNALLKEAASPGFDAGGDPGHTWHGSVFNAKLANDEGKEQVPATVLLLSRDGNKRRAAYTTDGISWKKTPEYNLDGSVQACYIRRLPGMPGRHSGVWLELLMTGEMDGAKCLLMTRIEVDI